MATFVLLVLAVIVIFLLFRTQTLKDQIASLDRELSDLKYKLTVFSNTLREKTSAEKTSPAPQPSAPLPAQSSGSDPCIEKPVGVPPCPPVPSAAKTSPASGLPPLSEPPPLPPEDEQVLPEAMAASDALETLPDEALEETDKPFEEKEEAPRTVTFAPPASSALQIKWREFKKNVDWEQFTGVKLFAWLGGLALFIGAIFFVKYSIDNNLIEPQLRLAIGALVGMAMIVSSFIINRERYVTTVHTMAAGGIAVLYAVSFTGTVYYGFIPKMFGFGLISLISASAFVLAVFHKGRFISVLGAIGAYATPLLISTGHPNLAGLFIYLTVVNLGLFEVIRRTGWMPLCGLVTFGTLFTLAVGNWGTTPPSAPWLIALIWLSNLLAFSVFFRIYRGQQAASRPVVWSLRLLFGSALVVALVLMDTKEGLQYLPLLMVTVATLMALILSYTEKSWSVGFILYTLAGFAVIAVWSYLNFDLSQPSVDMLLFFLYGVIAGAGPVLIIRKHGIDPGSLLWLKSFPLAMAVLALAIFFKSDVTHFLFWPMLLGISLLGIFVGLLVGSLLSVMALGVLLLVGGAGWIFKTPSLSIGYDFFVFIVVAGLLVCFLTAFFLKKASSWRLIREETSGQRAFKLPVAFSSEWVTALPVVGPFVLLTLVLMRQDPVAPNPAMAAGVCFLAVALFLARYFKAQEILVVALAAMAITQLSWGLQTSLAIQISWLCLGWSAFFWTASLIVPHILNRPEKDWKIAWYAWSLFEWVMACLVLVSVDNLWGRDMAGWIPLGLALGKLPFMVWLLQRLEGTDERNAIVAFSGGVLLFYVSSIPVLLLGNAWIGVAFGIEALLLLWFNRRIEHPGLRWVSLGLAPVGLMFVLSDLQALKTAGDLPVLNLAVLSVLICVLALSFSVKLAGYPRRKLIGDFDLPLYFLWLAAGSGFFLLNLIITDIFGGKGGGFQLDILGNIHQYISHTLLWTVFGALLLRIRRVPAALKIAGLVVTISGIMLAAAAPFHFRSSIGQMTPFFNPALILFAVMMVVLVYLGLSQKKNDWGGQTLKNVYIAMGLIVGLLALTTEASTVFNAQVPFHLISGHSSAMTLALIFSWFVFGLGFCVWPRPLHPHFRLAGAVLIVTSLSRAVYYPLAYARDFGAVTPILNMPTLIFLILIAGLLFLAIRGSEWKWESISPRFIWGALLVGFAFYVTNVEVASVFGMFNKGSQAGQFTFYTHGRLSQQLAYSISWLVFAIILLASGIRLKLIHLRWVALALLVITALKVFIKDLWVLGQLYRVFSFIGLAVTLMLVSFIYQRYLSGKKDKGEKS